MSVTAQIDDRQVILSLGGFQATVSDRTSMYRILGTLMVGSVQQTFRDEGSPAGSWPALALSTLKRKGYKSGHKLLILSGRLFRSITFVSSPDSVTIGPRLGIPYAAVQNFGSADRRGGSVGAQARITGRSVNPYDYSRRLGFGLVKSESGRGKGRKTRIEGPGKKIHVEERYQNIPARPYLVVRPGDPDRCVQALNLFIASRSGGLA